jgi:hypothetical protein
MPHLSRIHKSEILDQRSILENSESGIDIDFSLRRSAGMAMKMSIVEANCNHMSFAGAAYFSITNTGQHNLLPLLSPPMISAKPLFPEHARDAL